MFSAPPRLRGPSSVTCLRKLLHVGALHSLEAYTPGAVPVQRESRDRPPPVAHKPNGAHIVSDERVLEDRMQSRGLNDKAGIAYRHGVCHVQFIASVFA